jgi:hypothetical protein
MWKILASGLRLPFHEGPSKSKIELGSIKILYEKE